MMCLGEKYLDTCRYRWPWLSWQHSHPDTWVSRVNYLGRFDDNYDGRLSLLATS
ncbi:MAG: hypothetical protein IPG31_02000 [Nitrosomonas sp.]|jgi:hypothetical protein|nr:hypothetical protein [Nitrosomonas sp.]